jgi:pyruvate dehydrogenase E2 component (dihydrolipoamide acetyltransferase)
MPMLGADMEAGTLIEWLKHPGDPVHRGDIIAVVDTQKGAIEIEVFEDGIVDQLLVQPGQQVPVGTVLAIIDGQAQKAAGAPAVPAPIAAEPAVGAPQRVVAARQPAEREAPAGPGRPKASPAARQAARARSVDLATVAGTGPGGAITVADVERAATPAPAAGTIDRAAAALPASTADRTAAMRAAIAAAMARSKREIPHFYLSTTIDMTAAERWLEAENARRPITERLLPVVLLVKAVALALRDVPELNGFHVNGTFQPGGGIHVGCAVSLRGGGLVAPAVHDVDQKPLLALMADLSDLVSRARRGSLRSSELSDSTITVTSLGETGVESTFGIIFPPQVALVGFGRVVRRPWVSGESIVPRSVMTATLSADHRVVDGHRGGVFLAAVDRRLQAPEAL